MTPASRRRRRFGSNYQQRMCQPTIVLLISYNVSCAITSFVTVIVHLRHPHLRASEKCLCWSSVTSGEMDFLCHELIGNSNYWSKLESYPALGVIFLRYHVIPEERHQYTSQTSILSRGSANRCSAVGNQLINWLLTRWCMASVPLHHYAWVNRWLSMEMDIGSSTSGIFRVGSCWFPVQMVLLFRFRETVSWMGGDFNF
jgi:hypothetical protein